MNFDPRLKLSPHFMLTELTRTDVRNYIDVNHNQAMPYYNNMAHLCQNVLEAVREITGPIIVTSGFRCIELNKLIGGSATSQHMIGEAADTIFTKGLDLKEAFNEIAWSKVPYSQVIFEFGQWVHIGIIDKINYPNKVGQKFIAERKNGATVYTMVTKPL